MKHPRHFRLEFKSILINHNFIIARLNKLETEGTHLPSFYLKKRMEQKNEIKYSKKKYAGTGFSSI